MEDWDPRKDDYEDKSFNSYTRGPGRNLSLKKNFVKGAEKHVELYVTGIPQELTEDGMENLFGRAGTVERVRKMKTKRENSLDTFGFVTMGSINDAEQAIAELDGFRVGKFSLRVSVSLSKEDLERRRQQQQELNLVTARGFDEGSSDSESISKDPVDKPKMMNGVGKAGDATSAMGVGRGKKLREMTDVSPAGDARSQKSGLSSQLGNLTVQVDNRDRNNFDNYSRSVTNDPTNMQTPVGPGRSHGRGGSLLGDYEKSDSGYNAPRGRGGRGRGGRGRGFQPRGGHRGRGGGYYQNYYDNYPGGYEGGYGGGYQPPYMGRGMYMPTVYVDPYVGMMGAPHLLQPAVMNPGMMNNTMQQQMSMGQQTPMPQQTPRPQQTPMPRRPSTPTQEGAQMLRQECSVCGKLGLSRCSKCKVPYCSRECQEKDWAEHKFVCGMIKKDKDTADAFSDFAVEADEKLIPQVKQLMEKVTGDTIQVTKKTDMSPRSKSSTTSSRAEIKDERRVQVKQSDDERRQERRDGDRRDRDRQNEDRRSGRNTEEKDNQRVRGGDKKSEKKEVNERGCFNCGEKNHWKNECPKPLNYSSECYNCHKRGHLSKDCPLKEGKEDECYNCHQLGHISRDCPEKEENKRKNNAMGRNSAAKPKTPSPKVNNNEYFDDEEPIPSQSAMSRKELPKDVSKIATKKSPPSPPPKKSLPVATMPINEEIVVVITDAQDPGHFFVQMVTEQSSLPFQELMLLMHQAFSDSSPDVNEVLPGEIYAVRYSLDGSWNRAKVVKVTGDGILAQFLDFGNKETTALENMRQLTNDMMKLPAQGVLCALDDIMPKSDNNWSISSSVLIGYLTPDLPYKAKCKQAVDGPAGKLNKVVLKNNDGENVAQKLVSADLAKATSGESRAHESVPSQGGSPQSASTQGTLAVATMPLNEVITVVITDAQDPGHFFVQMVTEQSSLPFQELMVLMHQAFSDSLPDVNEVLPGEIYAVRYSLDGSWNRAKVVKVTGDGILAQFLDFGNKETTALENMRQLTNDMMKLPAQGVLCALDDILPKSDNNWSISSSVLIGYLTPDLPYKAKCKQAVDGPAGKLNKVVLKNNDGENVAQKLVSADLAKATSGESRAHEPVPSQGGSPQSASTQGTLAVATMPLNEVITVVITEAQDPGHFFVQMVTEQSSLPFQELMVLMHQAFSDSLPDVNKVLPGEIYAVRYSLDGSWNRAKVVKVTGDGILAQFLDFGNKETTALENMRHLTNDMMKLPAQGVLCALDGIVPKSDNNWSISSSVLLGYLTPDLPYKAKCKQAVDGPAGKLNKVVLKNNDGENVAQKLVSADLAKATSGESRARESVPSQGGSPQSASTQGTLAVATMPLNEEMTVVITEAQDPGHFFVQMVTEQSSLPFQELMVLMHQTFNDNSPDVSKVLPGEIYAVRYSLDGSWNRAKVVKVTGDGILAQFLDFGNKETTALENMRQLTNDMMKLPAQGVLCALDGIVPKSDNNWNISSSVLIGYLTPDLPYKAKCKQAVDGPAGKLNKLVLKNNDGENVAQKLVSADLAKATSGDSRAHEPVPSQGGSPQSASTQRTLAVATMPLNEEITVVITEAQDPGHFYVQMVLEQYTTPFQDLMVLMHQKFSDSIPDVNKVLEGETYAVRYSLDGSWNRAKVVRVADDGISVQFVDFGNKETASIENLRQLSNDMMKLPAQSVLCALDGIVPKSGGAWNISSAQLIQHLTPDIPYKAECKRVIDTQEGKVNRILLKTGDGESVAQNLIAADLVEADRGQSEAAQSASPSRMAKPNQGSNQSPTSERVLKARDVPRLVDNLAMGGEYPLMITDMRTPVDFSIQILDEENINKFTAFIVNFNQECARLTETEYRPQAVGELVASRFSQDEGWYRAEVLEILDSGARVLYIDYLNSETVKLNMMRKAMPLCSDFPAQGVACCLHGISQPIDGQWPTQVVPLFEQWSQNALQGIVKEIKDGVIAMELRDLSGVYLNEKVKSSMKKDVKKPTSVRGKINPGDLPLDGSKVQAVVSSVSAVDQVYVQELDPEQEKKRNEMMMALNQSLSQASDLESFEPSEGQFVAAVYSTGGTAMWFRGWVEVKVSESNFMILFVDYGNTECVQKGAIAPLEMRFMALPAMAVRCQLAGSENVDDKQTLQNLRSLMDHKMYVKAVDYVQGLFKVEMFLVDGTNVNEAFEFNNNSAVAKPVAKTPPKDTLKTPPKDSKISSPRETITVDQIEIVESSLPFDGTKVAAKVVLTESLSSFFVHKLDSDIDAKLMDLLKEMQIHYRDDNQIHSGKVGEYVAALFDDGSGEVWYRAKILHAVGKEVKVSIIDYGNVGFVGNECIRRLDKKFADLPAVAMKCRLNGCTGKESSDVIDEFKSVEATTVKVQAMSKNDDTYLVNLHLFDPVETSVATCLGLDTELPAKPAEKSPKPPTSTSNNLSRSPAAVSKSPASKVSQNISVLTELELPLNTDIPAVSYVIESLRSFYIQMADEETQRALASLMIELAKVCVSNTRAHPASAGEIVAALFDEGGDANWYRGQVLELIDSNQCKVLFVDYGNTEIVVYKDVRRLESRFLDLPKMAVHCRLFGVGEETENMLLAFKTISNVPVTVRAVSVKDGMYVVEVITSDNRNMNQDLGLVGGAAATSMTPKSPSTEIVDNLPKAISPSTSRLPKKVTSPPKGERKPVFSQTLAKSRPKGKEFKAIITSAVRPNHFHCQIFPEGDHTTLQELQFLSETMQLECEAAFEDVERQSFEVGELCCARFPVDNTWYRATVLEVFPDETVKVEYVDFGNQSEVPITQLRPVTEDYTRLPLLAFRCSLHGVNPVGSGWTREAVEEMSKFQDKQLEAKVICVNNDVYELDLTDPASQVNMAEHLISVGLAKVEDKESEGMSEMERLKMEKERLQRQLESMQAQMVAIQRTGKS